MLGLLASVAARGVDALSALIWAALSRYVTATGGISRHVITYLSCHTGETNMPFNTYWSYIWWVRVRPAGDSC